MMLKQVFNCNLLVLKNAIGLFYEKSKLKREEKRNLKSSRFFYDLNKLLRTFKFHL